MFKWPDLPTPEVGDTVLPLPGGSAPQWQGDWHELDCEGSSLLQDFSRRALDAYNISENTPNLGDRLNLTLIERSNKRSLVKFDEHLKP